MSARAALAVILIALAPAGCNGDVPEPAPAPAPRAVETKQRLPQLPEGWRAHVNRRGGFALGVPRGWRARDRGRTTLIRSFDRLVAISVVADRSAEALELELGEFGSRAAAALPGFGGGPRVGSPRRFRHRLDAVEVAARGTTADGVAQRISVLVLRRPRLVTLTAVIAANARPAARASRRLAVRVVRTLRSRPPRGGGQRSGRSG